LNYGGGYLFDGDVAVARGSLNDLP